MVEITCPCPPLADGKPRHVSDEVTLREKLGFVEATSVRNGIKIRAAQLEDDDELEAAEILAILVEGYVIYGVESWTLEDATGKPLPVTRGNIRTYILGDWATATTVGDAADDLYASAVMLPLLVTASTSSRPTPTDASTSQSPSSGTPIPKPSSPSSTSTTRTASTARTTSRHDGDSRSSPKAATAA